jgi:hypothetical protein
MPGLMQKAGINVVRIGEGTIFGLMFDQKKRRET